MMPCSRTLSRILLASVGLLVLGLSTVHAQINFEGEEKPVYSKLPEGKASEQVIMPLDAAREVVAIDATPSGSNWLLIDKFGLSQSIILNGKRFDRDFSEIPPITAQLSPNGKYAVWMGLMRNYTYQGFDSTVTSIYRDTVFQGDYVSEYNQLYFSRSGNHWAALLPYANTLQQGDRDLAIMDGKVISKGEGKPSQFSFTSDESSWMYRGSTDRIEKLVTPELARIIKQRFKIQKAIAPNADSVVLRFSPDIFMRGGIPDPRDYETGRDNTVRLFRTSFDSKLRDTTHSYITFHGKTEPMFRWISNVLMDTNGKHVFYLACDPHMDSVQKKNRDERRSVVVMDGKVIAGPYPSIDALFVSPSGKHYAFYTGGGEFYLDNKRVPGVTKVLNCNWSPDESRLAMQALAPNGKVTVLANGHKSADYLKIGRIGWTDDGKNVQYIAVQNSKLLKVTQNY